MPYVRAKEDVYLVAPYGLKSKGDEFAYEGPDNPYLEEVEVHPYGRYSTGELESELKRRGLITATNDPNVMRAALLDDDNAPEIVAENKTGRKKGAATPPPQKQGDSQETPLTRFQKFMKETSGGFHASDLDWTVVGTDKDGYPVVKGSPEDVSNPDRKAGTSE
jgi:hypothetical protein